MPDIGWSELLVIAILALVVIGPKDLPRFMRMIGIWIRKARGLAREFQDSMESLAREAEFEDLRKNVESLRTANPLREVETSIRDDMRGLDRPLPAAAIPAPPSDHPTGEEEGEEAWAPDDGPEGTEARRPVVDAGTPSAPTVPGEAENGERAAARAQP